ncbi:MAG: hypothetical protein GY842_26305 [bacterium]|nr:hypothetical protein [bacterium]
MGIRALMVWGLSVALILGCANAGEASVTVKDMGGDQFRVIFVLSAPTGTKSVHLAGSFNGWDPRSREMSGPEQGNRYRTSLILDKGRHEYKYVLDGTTWVTDPENPHKTEGYQNAVLFLGLPSPDDAGGAVPPPDPVEMAGIVEHPPAVERLKARLAEKKKIDPERFMADWFASQPAPLFTKDAVTFVYVDPAAETVSVEIAGYGSRTGYRLERLVSFRPVYAVSLERAKLPARMAYTFELQRKGRSETVVDPNAWSLTSRSGQPAALGVAASEKRGRIEVIRVLKPSAGGLRPRDVYVYLPPGYDAADEQRYPVLYMHDGQNCWDDPVEPFGHGGWCVNLTADRLIVEGKVKPFVAVGIANTPERMQEYGPSRDILSFSGHAYLQYLAGDVKAEIDRRYRTLSGAGQTALMGSSMGGLISLQGALVAPKTFGMAACLSPAFGFSDDSADRYGKLVRSVGHAPVRLYVDSGTAGPGQDGASHTREMVALLRENGWKDGVDLVHFEDVGAKHNERAWRARLERPLRFLFGR